ncbi:MAG: DedA family protein, partial [Campylobacter sp.]|nr:DedA family protein [Campylobacter sp.]
IKFCVINAICAIIWALSLGLIGFFAGDLVNLISEKIGANNSLFLLALLAILGLIWLYFSKASKKA